MGSLEWSKDGQYLQAADGSGTAIIRIRLSDHKTERVVDLKNFAPRDFMEVGLRSPPTIRPLCFAMPGPRMFTPSTGKSRNRFTECGTVTGEVAKVRNPNYGHTVSRLPMDS